MIEIQQPPRRQVVAAGNVTQHLSKQDQAKLEGAVAQEANRTDAFDILLDLTRLDENEAARADELSMPMQTILVPVTSGTFRIDDVPACPIEGLFSAEGAQKTFSVTVHKKEEAVLRLSTSSP